MPGDRERVAEFYSQSGAKIAVILATKFRIPSQIAQDAVHEIFVSLLAQPKIVDKLTEFGDSARFLYLLKAARRRAVSEVQHRLRTEKSLEELLAVPASPERVGADIEREDLNARLRKALEKVESPYREVLELLVVERKSAAEIGQKLGRPVNTVYQQVHRGIARLRRAVKLEG